VAAGEGAAPVGPHAHRMADAVSTFPQISLGSRGGVVSASAAAWEQQPSSGRITATAAATQAQGQLRVSPAGFQWRKAGGGKVVEIKREGKGMLHQQ
jgi:hypothetical protein